MTNTELKAIVNEINSMEELLTETQAIIDSLKDQIKSEMVARDTEILETEDFIIRWTSVIANRFDTTNFKKLNPTIYSQFLKQIPSRKFTISK